MGEPKKVVVGVASTACRRKKASRGPMTVSELTASGSRTTLLDVVPIGAGAAFERPLPDSQSYS